MTNVLVHQLQPDLYMNAVLYALHSRPSVTEIQVNKDGLWRAREGEEWQDIRNGPPESFQMPRKREELASEGDAGASCSSCPSRGQKRVREEQPKVPVATLKRQHMAFSGGVQGGQTTAGAQPPRPGNNTAVPAAAAQKTAEVIVISDSDDDDDAAAPALVVANLPARTLPGPIRVSNTSSSPSSMVSRGMMLQPTTTAPVHVPQVHLSTYRPNATAHPPSHAVQNRAMLPSSIPGIGRYVMPSAQMSMPQAQPAGYGAQGQQPHFRPAPAPAACDHQQGWGS
jgi:hypothetical protein